MKENRFLNRELSWLQFNKRVLEEAKCKTTALLEKVKFLSIFSTNLDEFFMVRVAGLKKTQSEDIRVSDSPDSMPQTKVLELIHQQAKKDVEDSYQFLESELIPALNDHGIAIEEYSSLKSDQKIEMNRYFKESIYPVLTPLAVDPAHPFPFLKNLGIYLLIEFEVSLDANRLQPIAFVEIPTVLPRLVPIKSDDNEYSYILLEDLIAEHLDTLFLGFSINDVFPLKVTRNLDFTLLESEVVDLLKSVQREVKNRQQADAVRLEISDSASPQIIDYIISKLDLSPSDVYRNPSIIGIDCMRQLLTLPLEELKGPSFNPRIPHQLKGTADIFSVISEEDLLIHHPYESFYTVVEFLYSAANDPEVLAIKQTLYRTSGDSPIIDALIHAAESGKHVTAVVELKARFDERNNIFWARRMERAGVNVVYGFIGLKTHAKATLVVRREGTKISRYSHLSTGNYNPQTAASYVDIGLITSNDEIGQDISILFNLLTGFNIMTGEHQALGSVYPNLNHVIIAPLNLRSRFIELIEDEIESHLKNGNGYIMAKMNALVDKYIIEALYKASQEGVRIKLIVRGICCLRPKIKNLSENIEVISIIDRFLEHSRIYHFHNNGNDLVFLGSADWMPRNMERRIEIIYPVLNKNASERILKEIIPTYWRDNIKSWSLRPDGTYHKKPLAGKIDFRAQYKFIEQIREQGLKSIPYQKAIKHKAGKRGGHRPVYRKSPERKWAQITKSKMKKSKEKRKK